MGGGLRRAADDPALRQQVVDDLLPHTGYGAGVWQAWEELLREGVLTAPRRFGSRPGAATAEADAGEPPETYERRWGLARFA